jgi:seryl-tRNA synthetase
MTEINWKLLVDALEFYKGQGFNEIPVDWHVPQASHNVTCSDPARMFHLKDYGVLVGSAEQAFIDMQLDGRLPQGRFVALTPCFRDEGAARDDLHALYFMKVELYSTLPDAVEHSERHHLCLHARNFMETRASLPIRSVPTEDGVDLEINGIEVGSYSRRSFGGISWTCGTGLAEPRFSMAISRKA